MGSFKLKLVAYFSLIALLPFAAAFSSLEAVTDKNETRRVDGTLETSVRAAQAAFVEEVDEAERVARRLQATRRSSVPSPPTDRRRLQGLAARRRSDRAARRPADRIGQEALGRPLDRRCGTTWPSRPRDLAHRDGQPPRRGSARRHSGPWLTAASSPSSKGAVSSRRLHRSVGRSAPRPSRPRSRSRGGASARSPRTGSPVHATSRSSCSRLRRGSVVGWLRSRLFAGHARRAAADRRRRVHPGPVDRRHLSAAGCREGDRPRAPRRPRARSRPR